MHPVHIREMSNIKFEFNPYFWFYKLEGPFARKRSIIKKFEFDIWTHHKNLHPVHIREISNIEFESNPYFWYFKFQRPFSKKPSMTEKFGFDIRTHHKNLHPVHIREMLYIEFESNPYFLILLTSKTICQIMVNARTLLFFLFCLANLMLFEVFKRFSKMLIFALKKWKHPQV